MNMLKQCERQTDRQTDGWMNMLIQCERQTDRQTDEPAKTV